MFNYLLFKYFIVTVQKRERKKQTNDPRAVPKWIGTTS